MRVYDQTAASEWVAERLGTPGVRMYMDDNAFVYHDGDQSTAAEIVAERGGLVLRDANQDFVCAVPSHIAGLEPHEQET